MKADKEEHSYQRDCDKKTIERDIHIQNRQSDCFINDDLPVGNADHSERKINKKKMGL